MSSKSRKKASRRGSAGPIAFFVAVFIVALGSIQLASTFHTYALNMAELNGLKKQGAALIAQRNWKTTSRVGMTKLTLRRRQGIVWDSYFQENRRFVWNIPKRCPAKPQKMQKRRVNRRKPYCLGIRKWRIRSNKPTNRTK